MSRDQEAAAASPGESPGKSRWKAAAETLWPARLRGGQQPRPARPPATAIVLAWLGSALTIALLAGLTTASGTPLILGSFGASCVLVFGFPDVPFSQPRHIIGGHLLCSLTGLVFLTLCGPHWWAAGLATATAVALMMATRTVHPPAGSNPVIVFLSLPGWDFLVHPTLAGAVLITIIALVWNNITRRKGWPAYW